MIELPIPVPPMLERALGYEGDAARIAVYWKLAGDEVEVDDGRLGQHGEWDNFLLYTQHRAVAPYLVPYDLGSAHTPAQHWLVLDRQARRWYVAPAREAAQHVRAQWPRPSATRVLTLEDSARKSEPFRQRMLASGRRPIQEIVAEAEAQVVADMGSYQRVRDELRTWLEKQPEQQVHRSSEYCE